MTRPTYSHPNISIHPHLHPSPLVPQKNWRHAVHSLATLALHLCAGAVTLPAIEITEFMRAHRELLDRLVPPASPLDVAEFLRMNDIRGNVLVNKDDLGRVLQAAKGAMEKCQQAKNESPSRPLW